MSYQFPPQFMAAYRDAVEEGLTLEAHGVLGEAKKIVPLLHGPLDQSGEVITFWIGDIFFAVVGFGGTPETAEYAEIQHENMAYKHAPGRQAKYLEVPAMAATPGMDARVAQYAAQKVGP